MEEAIDEESVLRILIATDNHLGFMERDQFRGMDSFAAFEEILATAKTQKADFVLLAGDLFHENKPSRRTLVTTMGLMRKYCLGDNPIQFEVLSEQASHFRSGRVNYEDPSYSIDLPIFAIHGNHDDPSREGGEEPLSALDILGTTNLINYFGKSDRVDEIEVNPVLIEKGETKLALYGLGNMRDERLNRVWAQQKVKFLRPALGDEEREFFNVFALHQNKNAGRGTKNCVHESMIPEWMDFVVWGETSTRPQLIESVVGTFQIIQPGSSIATSLVEAEARPKHIVMLTIYKKQYKAEFIPLTQVRPFRVGEINLKRDTNLDPDDPQIETKMSQALAQRVRELAQDAQTDVEKVRDGGMGQEYRVLNPEMVLVRLRVEHFGFPSINNQRFGGQFLREVANPGDLLLFSRKQAQGARTKPRVRATGDGTQDEEVAEIDKVKVEDLVKQTLAASDKKLNVLPELDMALALEDFVTRHNTSAIMDTVETVIEKVISALRIDKGTTTVAGIKEVLTTRAGQRVHTNAEYGDDEKDQPPMDVAAEKPTKGKAARKTPQRRTVHDEDDDEKVAKPKATTKKAAARGRGRKIESDEENSDLDDLDMPRRQSHSSEDEVVTTKAKKPRTTVQRKKKAPAQDIASDQSDTNDQPEPVSRGKRPARRAAATRVKYTADDDGSNDAALDDSDEFALDDDDSDEEETHARAKTQSSKRKVTKATPKTSSKAAAKPMEEVIDLSQVEENTASSVQKSKRPLPWSHGGSRR